MHHPALIILYVQTMTGWYMNLIMASTHETYVLVHTSAGVRPMSADVLQSTAAICIAACTPLA